MASINTPKKYFTAFIQPPALGNTAPADRPINSKGTPMPSASTNSAVPPSTVLPVCAMKASAAASGGATHGPTMTADKAPIVNTPATLPPFIRFAVSENLLWIALGSCSSKKPNIDSASATNTSAPMPSAHGFCSAFEISVPDSAAATPASAYVIAMPSTYASASKNPEVLVSFFCPAIMPDKIGIIGNTQGVNDSSKPKPKKLAMIAQKLPPFSTFSILDRSDSDLARGAALSTARAWATTSGVFALVDVVPDNVNSRVCGG